MGRSGVGWSEVGRSGRWPSPRSFTRSIPGGGRSEVGRSGVGRSEVGRSDVGRSGWWPSPRPFTRSIPGGGRSDAGAVRRGAVRGGAGRCGFGTRRLRDGAAWGSGGPRVRRFAVRRRSRGWAPNGGKPREGLSGEGDRAIVGFVELPLSCPYRTRRAWLRDRGVCRRARTGARSPSCRDWLRDRGVCRRKVVAPRREITG